MNKAPAEFNLAAVLQGVRGDAFGDGGLNLGDFLVEQVFICVPAKENVSATEGNIGICSEQGVLGSVPALAHFLRGLYAGACGDDIFMWRCDDDITCGSENGRGGRGEARGHQCVQRDVQCFGEEEQLFYLGISLALFPLGHRLTAHVQQLRKSFLGQASFFSQLFQVFCKAHGLYLLYGGMIKEMQKKIHQPVFAMAQLEVANKKSDLISQVALAQKEVRIYGTVQYSGM